MRNRIEKKLFGLGHNVINRSLTMERIYIPLKLDNSSFKDLLSLIPASYLLENPKSLYVKAFFIIF